MLRSQCLLALVALSIGCVRSWDIAITTGDQLEFYTNQTKTQKQGVQFRDLTALAYDAVHNMLLFVDKQSDNASIFSFHLTTKKYQSLVRRKFFDNIQGLAFDPVNGLLFWTDTTERSIFKISLRPGSKNDVYGNLLIKMDDEIPRAIAVDSCRGYIYWTNTNVTKPTIERSRFDGTERKVVVESSIFMPTGIAVDQRTKRLFWADDREGIHYSIESSDLEGGDRKTLFVGIHHQPNALTVSKDYIYWVDWGYKSVWKLPKDAPEHTEPEKLVVCPNDMPFGIVANYKIEDQVNGSPECADLLSLAGNQTDIIDTFSVPKDVGLFCVHGEKINGKAICKCKSGYAGERCDISVCQNYCLQGDCSLTDDGKPTCRCQDGYTGSRCEINICDGYCLNNGDCSSNERNEPVCKCIPRYEGARCEVDTETLIVTTLAPEACPSCNCTTESSTKPVNVKLIPHPAEHLESSDGEFVEASTCNDGWDPVRDPIIMILGIIIGLLFLACTVLILKIMQLKKRPRIKKRIIVNKNVTPMTARPDQCEITIENCCNMNVCETPCFEPRSTIRPSLLDTKPGKEEKRNLISNMEYPDDLY